MMNWLLRRPGPSGFSYKSTAEDVTNGIDASGSIAIVTGATSGIGAETARVLSLRGANVIMGVRNLSAGNAVKEKLTKEIDNAKVDVLELDLSSLASVQNFASNFKSLNLPLNILINNAGVMMCPYELSKDGIELQFATNHLGHFFLTNLLLETMKKTALETGIEGRIVNVSSEAHRFCYSGGIRFDKINDQSGYSAMMAYGQSKLANILHANELTKRLQEEGSNVTANSLHPGTIATSLVRHSKLADVFSKVFKFALKNIPQGAATQCFVALSPKVRGVSGKYFLDSNEYSSSSLGTDAELGRKLWEFSQSLVFLHVKEHAPN